MHKSSILLASLTLTVLNSLSCAKSESGISTFLKRPVTGEVNGEDFEIKYAFIDPTIKTQNQDDYVFILLPLKPQEDCPKEGVLDPKTPMIMVPAPKRKKKTFKLRAGTARSMVFQYMQDDQQVAATASRGKIRLTKIGKNKIKGKVVGRIDDQNWINGYFTAHICEWNDFKE